MTDLPKTRKAMTEVALLFLCSHCNRLPEKPFFFKSSCEHLVCRKCVLLVSNLICQKCGKKSSFSLEELKDGTILGLLYRFRTKLSQFAHVANNDNVEERSPGPKPKESRMTKSRPTTSDLPGGKSKKAIESTSKVASKTQLDVALPHHERRNVKGETALHVACIAGNLNKVKSLLAAGADVNVQDNARWTPLHEAASHGFQEIVTVLLDRGALVNYMSGEENLTPLHEAVQRGFVGIATELVRFGANITARDIHGRTPIDYAVSPHVTTLLSEADPCVTPQLPKKPISFTRKLSHMIVFGCNLSKECRAQLKTVAATFKLKTSNTFSTDVTHIVVETKGTVCKPSFILMRGMLLGKSIISFNWILKCLEQTSIVDPLLFEVTGTYNFPKSNAPQRSRENALNKLPPLFNGCSVFLRQLGSSTDYSSGTFVLPKAAVADLIKTGGGTVLGREPKDDGSWEQLAPYHASPAGSLARCSHYIVYQEGDSNIKYNMSHIKALPVDWLFDCIETFRLMDPDQA